MLEDLFSPPTWRPVNIVKPWSNGPASSRKWTQVELAKKIALGDQTDSQVSSQVHASRK